MYEAPEFGWSFVQFYYVNLKDHNKFIHNSSELPYFCFQCLIYLSLIYSKLLSQSFYEDSNSKDYKGIFFYLGLLLGKIIKENQNLDLLI